jgi:Nitrate/nitrite transporter
VKNKGISVDTKGNIHVDDAFLQSYVDKGGEVQTAEGTPVNATDELITEVGKDHKSSTKAADTLHKEVDKQQGNVPADKSKAEIKAEEAARRLNARRVGDVERVARKVKQATDPAIRKAGHLADRAGRARTVGGVGLLLVVLFFLLFIVVEVNAHGDTRIKQLWYMLVGRAALIGRKEIVPNKAPKAETQNIQDVLVSSAIQGLGPVGQVGPAINDLLQNFYRDSGDTGF